MTVNEQLAEAARHHAVDLSQYSRGVSERMVALLNRVDTELAAALRAALIRLPADSFTVERLQVLLASVRAVNAQVYGHIGRVLPEELVRFAQQEALYQLELFDRVVPADVRVRFPVARLELGDVYAAVTARPFQGRLLREWAQTIEASRMALITDAIRRGYVEGRTTDEIVRSLRGTRVMRYTDGVIERSRRELRTIVHTAVQHTAAVARDNAMQANADIVKAVEWLATLDTHTSPICRQRDQKRYTLEGHKPIGHSLPWMGGPGRAHMNCRSTSLPVLKSWAELGFNIRELPASTRASMDGQVPDDLTYAEWFKRQTPDRQDDIVGPTRGRLMRSGGLPYDRLYTPRGQYLTLDQLRARNAAHFKRAGL